MKKKSRNLKVFFKENDEMTGECTFPFFFAIRLQSSMDFGNRC